MKRVILLSLISFCLSGVAYSQNDPLYAQYLNNPFVINPAYTGFQNNLNATLSYRKQWAGFDGSPVTVNASAHTSMIEDKMGAGIMIVQDKIGVYKNSDILLTYSYKIDLGEQKLTFGLQGGLTNYRIDNSELNVYDPNGVEFLTNQNITKPAFGAGALFSGDRFLVGLSVPRMLKHRESFEGDDIEVYQQHLYFTGSYSIFVSHRVRFKPSVLMKAVKGAPFSVDYNASFNIDERYTAGAYTRNFQAYGILAQAKIGDRYRIGYAFEIPTNESVGTRFTSHEITLGVNLAVFDFHDITSVTTF